MRNSRYFFWDTETTGLNKAFHMPVEIGWVATDTSLTPTQTGELTCRPSSFVLPEPGALVTTRRFISDLMSRGATEYEMASRFAVAVGGAASTCFVSFNGIAFDDPMMQHSFYRSLRDPYGMMKGGGSRIDLLPVMRLLHALERGGFTVPRNAKNQPVFRLDQLAPLNGFSEAGAHSAVVDARASLHIARLIRDRVPVVWARAAGLWSKKEQVGSLLESSKVVIQFEWNWQKGAPVFKALAPIARGRGYAGEYVCVDLSLPVASYSGLSEVALGDCITIGPKARPICTVRLNAMPIVFSLDDPLISEFLPEAAEVLVSRAKSILGIVGLKDRVLGAVARRRDTFEEPAYVEQQLYSGGFISAPDELALTRFHAAPIGSKYLELLRVRDERLKYLGTRLLFEEDARALPTETRDGVFREREARLHAGDGVPWTTFSSVLREIEERLPAAGGQERRILLDYKEWVEERVALVLHAAE